MHDVGAAGQLELIIQTGPKAGLAIVETTLLVDRDQHVVIDVARIGILGRPVFGGGHRAEDAPRPGPEKALTRHRRKGSDHGARADLGRVAQFLGVSMPSLQDRISHFPPPSRRHANGSIVWYITYIEHRTPPQRE